MVRKNHCGYGSKQKHFSQKIKTLIFFPSLFFFLFFLMKIGFCSERWLCFLWKCQSVFWINKKASLIGKLLSHSKLSWQKIWDGGELDFLYLLTGLLIKSQRLNVQHMGLETTPLVMGLYKVSPTYKLQSSWFVMSATKISKWETAFLSPERWGPNFEVQ